MKVCVVNPNYYRSSGVTVAIRRIFQGVSTFGIEQYFINCCYGSEEEDKDWIPQEQYCEFKLMTSNPVKLAYNALLFINWLRKHNIHIVHVHHRRLAAILSTLQFLGDFEIIYTSHLTYPFAFWFWLASPKLASAISQSVMKNLQMTTRAKRTELIGNSNEFPLECPNIRVEQVKNRAICIARLEPVKGHTYLIDAWKILKDKDFNYELILVGEGSLRQQLEEKVVALNLAKLIKFRGFQKNIVEEINCCLFAILVSSVEGLPVAVIEAAACGRATLLNDVDGSRDCLPPQEHMINRLPNRDTRILADALEIWFSNPLKTINEGRTFFDFHKTWNSTEAITSKYVNLYKEVSKI